MSEITNYLKQIEADLQRGNATEHTHRPALKSLLESLDTTITAVNEPKRVECGAPDYVILRGSQHGKLTIGYIEAKDVGVSLTQAEKSEQLKRYLRSLENLILTDYIEFRWYVDGSLRASAKLGQVGSKNKIVADKEGQEKVAELLQNFLAHAPQAIDSPRELAERMARLTHMIRDIIITAFENNKASELLNGWRKAFADVLIDGLDLPENTSQFADMFAQTLTYGLFSARVMDETMEDFSRQEAQYLIPKTNPFLRSFFVQITGPDLDDEPFVGFVEDLVSILAHADIPTILEKFGKRTRQEDPIVHFYETFLATYDPKLRVRRGVYYTPQPVVSYIVRSVDHILKTRFNLSKGLADTSTIEYKYQDKKGETVKDTAPKVLVLDPAAGTATFMYTVIDNIRQRFMESGNAGMWSGFVRDHLLPRLFCFELMMAPYAVAHLKLGMQLAGQDLDKELRELWAYDFASDARLGVYLTNTLEKAERKVEGLFGPMKMITEEAEAANHIKRDLPIMVVIGNPPYANFGMMNKGPWITEKMKDWKPEGEKKWNPDDFMKFIRWAQWRIEQTGAGILAFITNHTFIDGITHRKMRQSLLESFDEIFVLDLHGNTKKLETSPDGSPDYNIFDILPGVAISIFIKKSEHNKGGIVYHAELWGRRDDKYNYLLENDLSTTQWLELNDVERQSCLGSYYFYTPIAFDNIDEYCQSWSIKDIFPISQNGIKTDRDSLFFDSDKEELKKRLKSFYSVDGLKNEFRQKFNINDSSSYKLLKRRENTQYSSSNISLCTYRPFDNRWIYYEIGLTSRPAKSVMKHMMFGENLALLSSRQQADIGFRHVFCTNIISECCSVSLKSREITSVFPIYKIPEEDQHGKQKDLFKTSPWLPGKDGRTPNLKPQFVEEFAGKLRLEFISDGKGDLKKTFGPEDIFNYAYAVFHCPTYRERYAEFLKIDFPRLPLTSDTKLFGKLCKLGEELVGLHLLESPTVAKAITNYPVSGEDRVDKGHPKYLAAGEPEPGTGNPLEAGRVYINRGQYFGNVPPEVWEFQVGGYQVCDKWLKDRRGRNLTFEDLEHYQKVIVALSETIRLMEEVDATIPEWPIQ